MLTDKEIERSRYDERANRIPYANKNTSIKCYLAEPYHYYYKKINKFLGPSSSVLELGCGTGEHSRIPASISMDFIGMDISSKSLELLTHNIQVSSQKIIPVCGDIEKLPFGDSMFDVVLSAGSLSYGDNDLVMSEIYRVLKKNGHFICVDSLNNNFIYKANRFFHYLLGNRSFSTLNRMPDLNLLDRYYSIFGSSSVKFFGSTSYAMPIIGFLFGNKVAYHLSIKIDKLVNVRSSAFKFVMVLKK